ncbi:orf 74; IL-8 receptor family [Ateline gammaherpesvirus 3]|uniref:Orf 74 n=1 Tax=Ateline herpesvirus 3 TaxID=85618 RepID=Q9YTJ2_ATHV3|nr:orf 74; IL-8 receptor family [Ateline gammaherpesvirus 3]AAC95599.1 orf 74; IL-8 receptor family [Ateline gammaherpesvirus 3]
MELDVAFSASGDYDNYSYNDSEYPNDDARPCVVESLLSQNALTVLYVLMFLVNAVGNGLVLKTFVKHKAKAQSFDFLMMGFCMNSLSLAGYLLMRLFSLFEIFMNSGLCKLEAFLLHLSIYWTPFILVFISVLRCLLIFCATRTWVKNPLIGKVFLCCSFLFACFGAIPHVVYTSYYEPFSCIEEDGLSTGQLRTWLNSFNAWYSFAGPLLLTLICYTMSCYKIVKTKLSRKAEILTIITITTLLFILFCIPYYVLSSVDTLVRIGALKETCAKRTGIAYGIEVTYIFLLLYYCLLPFVFAMFGSLFRQRMAAWCRNIHHC